MLLDPSKLFALSPGQKRRKLALCFGALERDILGIAEPGHEYNIDKMRGMPREEYIRHLVSIVLKDPKLPREAKGQLETLLASVPSGGDIDSFPKGEALERALCNIARNSLLAIIGTFPAEWDMVIAPHPNSAANTVESRHYYPGVCVYAEDIRSPFNVGTIFRTAEAIGVDKVYLSPLCASPEHPRALRSSMGTIATLGYKTLSIEDLPCDTPIFALETGGTPIGEFNFPTSGIVLIGSEELGLSPAALGRATYGRVTIPMTGLKASLNVGVALGILLYKWTSSIGTIHLGE